MAKYVGKIFKVQNSKLGIKADGCHYVHVKHYDRKSKLFSCSVLTSLENEVDVPKKSRKDILDSVNYTKGNNENSFKIFMKKNYRDIRNGNIVPIAINKTSGFNNWMGYSKNVKLDKNNFFEDNTTKKMKIKKER